MNKIIFVIAIVLGLGASTFYFQNQTDSNESKSLSSEINLVGDAYIQKKLGKLKKSFEKVELEKLKQFEVDGFWCTLQKKDGKGVAYRYKDNIDALLKKRAENPTEHYQVDVDNSKNTKFRIIDNGLASLYARLDLIKKAEKSIELEYFIYRMIHRRSVDKVETAMDFIKGEKEEQVNLSTILITRELIKKALKGVKVRVLIDASGTVLDFKEDYYTAAHIILRKEAERMGLDYNKIKNNFVFKHYNVANKNKIKFASTVNLRNHRKLLMVDDKYALTGGRNIEDKYFDLDPKYNFHDRDVLVTYEPNGKPETGGLLVAIKDSFNGYWNQSSASKEIPFVKGLDIFGPFIDMPAVPGWGKAMKVLMTDTSYINEKVNTVGASNYNASSAKTCNKATYVTDKPIHNDIIRDRLFSILRFTTKYKEETRFTGRVIEEIIKRSIGGKNKNILLSSPYLSQNCRTKIITEELLAAGATIDAYTNSLASTDAVYNAALFYKRADKFISYGAGLIAHSAEGLDREGIEYIKVKDLDGNFVNPRDKTWGLHSKSHVYGDKAIYIGTYNLDNRSSIYNTEMGVFCEDSPELVTELRDKINYRVKNSGLNIKSIAVGEKPTATSNRTGEEVDPHGVVSEGEIKLMQKIFKYVKQFEFLF